MEGNGDGDMANTVVGHGGEVLTVQVGGFSNLVAAHYWNAQTAQFMFGATEEANDDQEDTDGQSSDDTPTGARRPVIDVAHDCLFRAGSAALDGRVTYLPRTVVVDLNGVVPQVAPPTLEPQPLPTAADAMWHTVQSIDTGGAGAAAAASAPADGSTPSEDTAMAWCDILEWPLHPASSAVVKAYRYGDTTVPFDRFPLGDETLARRDFSSNFDDAVHFFLEECDRPQGIQLLCDTHDGFAGLGASICERLRDDHGKIVIFNVASVAPAAGGGRVHPNSGYRIVNQASSMVRLAAASSVVVPAGGTDWTGTRPLAMGRGVGAEDMDRGDSGIAELVAAAMDTSTLSYRLKASPHNLGSVVSLLQESSYGSSGNFASLGISVPLFYPVMGHHPDGVHSVSDALHKIGEHALQDTVTVNTLSPDYTASATYAAAHCVVRGAAQHAKAPVAELASRKHSTEYDRCRTVDDMISRYLAKSGFARKYFVTEASNAYPRVATTRGRVFAHANPALAWLAADPQALEASMAVLLSHLRKTSARTQSKFVESGMDTDAFEELRESMSLLTGHRDMA
eukprot:m.187719 g.187719  ORF g.187719 m.187719 type:complete len:568 (+) comp17174_c0_seq1:96-1799(+)